MSTQCLLMSPLSRPMSPNVDPKSTPEPPGNILSRAAAQTSCYGKGKNILKTDDIGRHWTTSIPYRYPAPSPSPAALAIICAPTAKRSAPPAHARTASPAPRRPHQIHPPDPSRLGNARRAPAPPFPMFDNPFFFLTIPADSSRPQPRRRNPEQIYLHTFVLPQGEKTCV